MKLRKAIHISGVFIPLLAGIAGKIQVVVLMVAVLCVFVVIEALKHRISKRFLALVYREVETGSFSIEPFSYFISIISILVLSFYIDEKICFAAIAILATGDGFAGVIGYRYGRRSISFSKSWEGTIAGFIAASLAGFYFAGVVAIAGSFAGMAAEAASRHDNFVVPYAALVSMYLAQAILLP
ncbi:MAG: phosphatidate cytidylyltransferase [Candidatus Methanoperedens sp.]|nr:phosphatidate cytidylyltransferase [Candidatus Methanoperedens sp.]